MRRAHELRPMPGARVPTVIAALAAAPLPLTATDPDGGLSTASVGALWTARRTGSTWSPPVLHSASSAGELLAGLDALACPGRRVVLYGDRLADSLRQLGALSALPRAGWRLERAIVEDPPTILRWRRGRASVLMLDARNYGVALLDSAGCAVGWECAQSGETRVVRPPSTDGAVLSAWRTLSSARELIDRWLAWDAGTLGPTLASSAMNAYRHRHLTTPVLIDDHPEALALARAAYVGGRCEAYRLGELPGPVALVDVRSMYPAVMRSAPIPVRLAGVYRSVAASELATLATDTAAVADVTIHTEQARYPVRVNGRPIYPAGRHRTVLADPELRDAARRGLILDVHRVALYDAAPIFTSWVDEWHERRLRAEWLAELSEASLCKLVLNALTGKWGQVGSTLEAIDAAPPDELGAMRELDLDTGDVYDWRTVGGYSSWRLRRGETRDSHPAIAATITSLGRLRLLELLEAIAPEPVWYCDTDSAMTSESGAARIVHPVSPTELGEPRLVGLYQTVVVRGRRNYDVDQTAVVAGLPRSRSRIGAHSYAAPRYQRLPRALAERELAPRRPTRQVWHLT